MKFINNKTLLGIAVKYHRAYFFLCSQKNVTNRQFYHFGKT